MSIRTTLGLFLVILAFISARSATLSDDGKHILVCKQDPIELGIVLDSSSSIRGADFNIGKEFLQDFVNQYDINGGYQGVRVSIITFGRGIYIDDSFDLDTYNTKEEILNAIAKIPHRAGLYTDTGKAIHYMHEIQLSKDVVRPYAEKIGLVITDGNSQEWEYTRDAAAKARADNITMLAVGVGYGVREEELLNIAGNASRVVRVDNYNKLSDILQDLARKTCVKKLRPTTPPPMTVPCGELNPADVYFAFSPADLGADATSWTTSFISQTISSDDMDNGFRYGVVSGSCPDDEGFDLDEYETVDDIRHRLDYYTRPRSKALVERIIHGGYSAENGGRANASKVAVLVASGGKKGQDILETEVAALVESGITVYIADPTGQGVEIEGAITLSGRSSRQQSEDIVGKLCPE